jgi:menaquinone-specific isochorismate synthase
LNRVGWIDANGDGEWAIALRCGQLSETDPHQIRLFAGVGSSLVPIPPPS